MPYAYAHTDMYKAKHKIITFYQIYQEYRSPAYRFFRNPIGKK